MKQKSFLLFRRIFEMRKTRNILLTLLCFIFAFTFLAGPTIAAERRIITGTINDDYQVVTDDNQVYDVADNEKGDEMLELIGKKVKVTGMVEESEGDKIITVMNYEVMEE
jgi:hypothetical protein